MFPDKRVQGILHKTGNYINLEKAKSEQTILTPNISSKISEVNKINDAKDKKRQKHNNIERKKNESVGDYRPRIPIITLFIRPF